MVDGIKQSGNFAQQTLAKSNYSQNSSKPSVAITGGDGVDKLDSKAVVAEMAEKPAIDLESVERIKSAIKRG